MATHRKYPILIAALCAVYVAVRVWRLTDACLWFDEIFGIHAAGHSWSGMWWFVALDLIHPPLFYALLKVWIGIGGESVLWVRLFPVFWSTLALFPFLHLCRELKLKASATAIALFLFSVNGALIKYAQEVRMYSLVLCFSLFSIWLFARFFYRGKNIWILTLVNILLVYSHYFGWLVVATEVLIILIMQRIKLRHMLTMSGILAAACVPWLIAVWQAASGGSEVAQNIGWIGRPGFREILDLILDIVEPFYAQVSSVDPISILWVSLPMVLVFLIAKVSYLVEKRSEDRERMVILSLFVGLPITAALLISWLGPYSVWGSRHLIVIFAPASILFAVYLSEIRSAALRYFLICVIAAASAGAFVRSVSDPAREQIWCAWEPLAREWALVPHLSAEPKRLYVFEDLAAYQIWFANRLLPANRVVLVKGVGGVLNDEAYFLPRGFDDVERTTLENISSGEIWIAFRQRTREEPPGISIITPRMFEAPVTNLENRGYVVEDVRKWEAGEQTAFLVKMVRKAGD